MHTYYIYLYGDYVRKFSFREHDFLTRRNISLLAIMHINPDISEF